jgi:hypothetical protein
VTSLLCFCSYFSTVTAKSYYPSSSVSPVSQVVDIFGKIVGIWQHIQTKFSPIAKMQDATP